MRRRRPLIAGLAAGIVLALVVPATAGSSRSSATPRWVTHVTRYPGGISNGVRAYLDPAVVQAQAAYRGSPLIRTPGAALRNVQMNDDSLPPLPQNETSVAYSLNNPMIAVAGANDYVSGGTVVMRTTDGGRHWQSTRVVQLFRRFWYF
jgi:hypothetical protein